MNFCQPDAPAIRRSLALRDHAWRASFADRHTQFRSALRT